jgi:hypothetical protein
MASANNFLRTSIPSLAAIEHRRQELLAWRAAQRASPTGSLDDPPGGENPYLEEEAQPAEDRELSQAFREFQKSANEAPVPPQRLSTLGLREPRATAPIHHLDPRLGN